MCRASLQRAEGVGYRAATVVVAVKFDIAIDYITQIGDQIVSLQWVGNTNRISNADAINARQVHRAVHGHHIGEVAAECIFRAESGFHIVCLQEGDHLLANFDDLLQALAVAKLAHIARRADVDISAIDAAIHRQLCIVRIGADMCQQLEAARHIGERPDGVGTLWAGDRRRQLHVLHAESIQQRGYLALVIDSEMRTAKLLALAQGGVDEMKAVYRDVSVVHRVTRSHSEGFKDFS